LDCVTGQHGRHGHHEATGVSDVFADVGGLAADIGASTCTSKGAELDAKFEPKEKARHIAASQIHQRKSEANSGSKNKADQLIAI
jgi:hypothetical protein